MTRRGRGASVWWGGVGAGVERGALSGEKKINAGSYRGATFSILFCGNRQLFLVGSMGIISKRSGASA